MKKILPKLNLSKILITFAFLMSYTLGVNAQSVADYTFNSSTGTYSEITGTTTGATGDDALSAAIDIGFTIPFKYNNIEYTQVKVSTNGWMDVGANASSNTNYNNLSNSSNKCFLAPLWDDLHTDDVQYLLSGTTPNQVFTVQWKNAEWNYSGTAGQNFQVKLYETTNVIEFVYGTMIAPVSPSASIGINDETGGSGHYISVTPADPPTTSSTTENDDIDAITYLTDGLTYTFTPYVVYNQTSIAEDPTEQVAAGGVSSIADTEGEAVDVFKFKITDAGSGDGLPTKVKQITIMPHAGNTADWTDHIQGVKLSDGSDITLQNVNITDTEIVIDINSGDLVITDNTSKEITMSVYLNTSGIVDGDVLQFIIDYDAHGFTSDYAGSLFATTFGAADIESNVMTIDVTATKLAFTTEPSTSVYINTNLDTPPVVTAYDANDNIDLGFTETVTLSNSGLIGMTGNPVAAVAGIADFATLQFTEPGGPLTLTASYGALTDAVTAGTVTVTSAPVVLFSEDFTGQVLPTDWTNVDNGTSSCLWGFNNPGGRTITGADFDSDFAIFDSDNHGDGDHNASLTTKAIDCSGYSTINLKFANQYRHNTGSAGKIEVSNNGTDWTEVDEFTSSEGYPNPAENIEYDISSVAANEATVYIKWTFTGNYDWWWAIDNVEISAITSDNMAYASSTVTQENTDLILAGDVNNEIIGIQVVTNNSANPLSLTNFSVNATGTTDINDIENAIIYYTGSSDVFATDVDTFNLTPVAPVADNFDIGGSQELVAGTNYFWLTYGVKSTATESNVVDAGCVNITVNSVVETPTVTAPAGTRTIRLPLTGAKTIGSAGDYLTFTEAINELNVLGIGTGGVTFNVAQGETFDEVVPVITVTGTAANPIVFQNDGTPGTNNPKITGTGTGSADAGIILETVSYITFNGIDIECQASNNDDTKRLEYGFWLKGDATNNNITNCTVDLTKTNTSSKGIYMNGDNNNNNKFYNNTIQDCFSGYYFTDTGDSNEIGTTGSGISTITDLGGTGNDVYGIYIAEQTGMKIFNTEIYNLTTDNDDIYGIYSHSSDNVIDIYNNKIYNISYTATLYSAYGIYFYAVNTSNVYNNMIYSIKAENSDDFTIATAGIFIGQPGTQINMYFNTIYLDYTSGDADNKSAALYFDYNPSSPIIDLRNNIFFNKVDVVTNGGTAYAFVYDNTDYSKIVGTTNNNLYYAGTPGANNLIFYDKTNSAQTLAEYQALVVTIEQQSITEANTPFVSTTATYNLHLNDANTTQCESGGTAVTGITTDIDDDARTGYPLAGQVNGGGTAPDIGADEGDFMILDHVVPVISYTVFGNSASLTSRTIGDITITDPSSVNTTTAKPRAYYKKSTDTDAYNNNTNGTNGWKFVEAIGTTSPFDFTIDYSKLHTTPDVGNTIQYFIVAQDEALTPNVGIYSGSFANAQSSVDLQANAFPIGVTDSYKIVDAIAGTVNVGDGETYTSLTAAGGLFEALDNLVVNQDVTVNVTSDLTEDGTHALNKLSEEGGNFTITIQSDTARNISGSFDGSLIRLSGGVDGIIFDGGIDNNLTIINTNSSSSVTIEVGEASYDITVKNCNIATGGNSSTTYGIYASGADISNIVVQDNVITEAKYGIYLSGTFSSDNDGNSITGNKIGSDVIDSRVSQYGIYVEYQTNLEISGNEIFNIINTGNDAYGIYLAKSNNVTISKNNLHDIVYSGGSIGYTAYGMYIEADEANPAVLVKNNLISHIAGDDAPTGIMLTGSATSGIDIYYNSIYLTPDASYGLEDINAYAASIIIEDGITGIDLRNNILQTSIGEEDASSYDSYGYAIYCGTTMPFATIDNNVYYVDNHDNNNIGYGNSTDYADLTTWKAWTTQDVNSLNDDPVYNSVTDLIPGLGSPVIGAGTPIAGITDDYADVTRDVTTPSIGAYEEAKDVTAPVITYTALENNPATDFRTFSDVVITDASGVNLTAARPRVYYKKLTDANVFNDNENTSAGWKFAEATGTGDSPFTLIINYTRLFGGTVAANDTIEYFVVAQDVAATPNVSANPADGFAGTSVSAITSVPTTPNTYIVREDDTPTVIFSPDDAVIDVALDVAITLTFNKYMYLADGSEIEAADVAGLVELKEDTQYGEDVDFTAAINAAKDVITITPDADLEYGQDYYVALNPDTVEDLWGNPVHGQAVIFTTIPSSDATLINLTIDDVTVTGFASGTYTYNVELPYGTTTVPVVDAMPTDSSDASYVVTAASALPGATTVVVTAQDETTELTYTINFTVALNTDATLSDLTIDGTTVTGFASGTYTYDVELPYGTATVPTVVATKTDANANHVVNDASALPGVTTVVVTAEDGTTELTYIINFTLATGIDDLYGLSSQVTVYPNPCNGVFTLDINNENKKDYRVEIIDILGKVIYNNEFKQVDILQKQIDISQFAKGIYFLKVNVENEIGIKRILVQ